MHRTMDEWFFSRHIEYVQELDRSFMSAQHLGQRPFSEATEVSPEGERKASASESEIECSHNGQDDKPPFPTNKKRFSQSQELIRTQWEEQRHQQRPAIPVKPPTWAVAESNDLLWLMRMPWRIVVQCTLPTIRGGEQAITSFLRTDARDCDAHVQQIACRRHLQALYPGV